MRPSPPNTITITIDGVSNRRGVDLQSRAYSLPRARLAPAVFHREP